MNVANLFLPSSRFALAIATLGILSPAQSAPGAQAVKHPNVLLITTDQQQVTATSAAGNALLKTPHIDSIAAQGVYFTKSYCAYPLCSPSRAALHTGRTPHEIKVDRNSVRIDPTVPNVLPTLCDYAGVQPPPAIRGQSLRSVIDKPELPGHEAVFSEMARAGMGRQARSFMVRTERYKYAMFPGPGGAELLFDLQSDPSEMKNLADHKAAAAELARHRQLLAQWRKTSEEEKYPLTDAPRGRRRRATE